MSQSSVRYLRPRDTQLTSLQHSGGGLPPNPTTSLSPDVGELGKHEAVVKLKHKVGVGECDASETAKQQKTKEGRS